MKWELGKVLSLLIGDEKKKRSPFLIHHPRSLVNRKTIGGVQCYNGQSEGNGGKCEITTEGGFWGVMKKSFASLSGYLETYIITFYVEYPP